MFNNSAPNEPPINSELIEKFFSGGDADAMIKEYNTMFESFPFVPIPSQTSARDLNAAKPMLFLAVLTATSWNDHQLQRKIDRLYREELANRTIIQPRRTLSLLQSLLVYLAWLVFPVQVLAMLMGVGITSFSVTRLSKYTRLCNWQLAYPLILVCTKKTSSFLCSQADRADALHLRKSSVNDIVHSSVVTIYHRRNCASPLLACTADDV
jgi:hypothetical protein